MSDDKGTIAFRVRQPKNEIVLPQGMRPWDRKPSTGPGAPEVRVMKNALGQLVVHVLFGPALHAFVGPMPTIDRKGLAIMVNWSAVEIELFVAGKSVGTTPRQSPTVH